MGVPNDTRVRMVSSAASVLTEHGVAGTTMARVLEHSHGPRGSVGHHFPGGRAELLADALRAAGEPVTQRLRAAAAGGAAPAEVFATICRFYANRLRTTEFTAGCPVGAAAQEAHHDPDLGQVVSDVVRDWNGALVDLLVGAGHPRAEARELASLCISSLEGAVMMARVQRSTRPIDDVRKRIGALL